MLRCSKPAGEFRVEFEYLDSLGAPVLEEYDADIGPHSPVLGPVVTPPIDINTLPAGFTREVWSQIPEVAKTQLLTAMSTPVAPVLEATPRTSQSNPYVGELCECELDWLAHLPGKLYSTHRRYHVSPVLPEVVVEPEPEPVLGPELAEPELVIEKKDEGGGLFRRLFGGSEELD